MECLVYDHQRVIKEVIEKETCPGTINDRSSFLCLSSIQLPSISNETTHHLFSSS